MSEPFTRRNPGEEKRLSQSLLAAGRRFARELGGAAVITMSEGPAAPGAKPVPAAPKDWRFKDPAWDSSRYFSLLQQAYLLGGRLLLESVNALPLNRNDRRSLDFLTRMAVDAVAPTNTLFGNPVALRTALDTRGRSLWKGSEAFRADVLRDHGMPKAVNTDAFTKGRDLAATPGSVVFRNRLVEIIQYEPCTETVHTTPILMCPPWVNKYYVSDLSPDRSMIEWLVGQGHTVFTPSYRNPGPDQADVGFDTYLRESVLPALDVISDITGADEVNVVGACLGGLLALMLAAWRADDERPGIGSVTLLNTLVDFTDTSDFARTGVSGPVLTRVLLPALEKLTARRGYLEGRRIDEFFRLLRANDLVWRYVASSWLTGEAPPAHDILAWNADVMNVPHRAQTYLLRELCMDNALARGRAELAGRSLRLDRMRQDVFVTAARGDHIIPWHAAYRTTALLSGDVRFLLVSGGHVAGSAVPPSPRSARYWTGDHRSHSDADEWLANSTEHSGSWWSEWSKWLSERAGAQRRPPPTGSARHPVLARAPGTYIHT